MRTNGVFAAGHRRAGPSGRARHVLFGLAAAIALGAALPGLALEARLEAPGAPDGLSASLRAASLTLSLVGEGERRSDDLVAAAQADYARLLGALYARGHYGATVSIRVDGREAADLSPFAAPARIGRIELRVDPGPAFRLGRAEVTPLAPGTVLPEAFRTGAPAETAVMREAVRAGVEGWRDAGYAKAAPGAQQIVADHRAERVDARFTLEPGRAARLGRLAIRGNDAVRAARIVEIAGFPEGAPFSPARLDRVADRLRRTGAFSSVRLVEDPQIAPDGTLGVTVELVEAPPRRFGAGVELTSDEGVALSGFWMHRNLRGGAQRLRFDAEVSGIGARRGGIDGLLAGRYTRPGTFTPDTALSVFGDIERRNTPNYRLDSVRVGGDLEHVFNRFLSGSAGVYARRIIFRGPAFGERQVSILALPVGLTWDGRDSRLDATSGLYGELGLKPFTLFTGDGSGARVVFDARAYRSLAAGRLVAAGRLQVGSLVGAGLGAVPPDFQFFSGGGGTVRGHDFESLGLAGAGGTTGGRSFLGAQLELRGRVTERIGVVGFLDAGHVGPRSLPGRGGDWHAGAGIGLRYDVGIGPIRFDVAVPVRGAGPDFAIYIGIGQAF